MQQYMFIWQYLLFIPFTYITRFSTLCVCISVNMLHVNKINMKVYVSVSSFHINTSTIYKHVGNAQQRDSIEF